MTATDELRKLLDERGVKWTRSCYSGMRYLENTKWPIASSNPIKFTEYSDGQTKLIINNATPEQAIAATLGRPKAKSHPYGYEPDTGAFDATRCECGCINDISARYCNDCGGEIEIDMNAEKELYEHQCRVFVTKHDDGSLEFCEKRYIAATLGGDGKSRWHELSGTPELAAQPDKEAYDRIAELTAERDELTNAINELQKKQPYCYNPEQPLDTLNTIGRYIDELTAERDELRERMDAMKAVLDKWVKTAVGIEPPEQHVDNAQADTREQLEADVHSVIFQWGWDSEWSKNAQRINECVVRGWLDRQAAITERKASERRGRFCAECEQVTDGRIAELTAERDELQAAIDAMHNGQFYAMYKAKCEECEEAVSFAKRLENAVNDGQPVTLFGVDYFTANQNKKLLAEHELLTKKLKRLRRRLAKAKKERDHLKTVAKIQADSFKKLEVELTKARSNQLQAGEDG